MLGQMYTVYSGQVPQVPNDSLMLPLTLKARAAGTISPMPVTRAAVARHRMTQKKRTAATGRAVMMTMMTMVTSWVILARKTKTSGRETQLKMHENATGMQRINCSKMQLTCNK